MNISELSNTPREVSIGNTTLKIRQLNIKELFGFFEDKIRAKKIKEAKEISASLEPQERAGFMIQVWKGLPDGEELIKNVTNSMSSLDSVYDIMYLASREYTAMTIDEFIDKTKDDINLNNIEELLPLVSWITGLSSMENDSGDSVDSVDSEKKTVKTGETGETEVEE